MKPSVDNSFFGHEPCFLPLFSCILSLPTLVVCIPPPATTTTPSQTCFPKLKSQSQNQTQEVTMRHPGLNPHTHMKPRTAHSSLVATLPDIQHLDQPQQPSTQLYSAYYAYPTFAPLPSSLPKEKFKQFMRCRGHRQPWKLCVCER